MAFVAPDKFTKNVSVGSIVVSPLMVTVIDFDVCPGVNVSVVGDLAT